MDALQQELAALDRFIELLQQEQAALVAADVDKLQSLSESKQKQSEQLNSLVQQRIIMIERSGFSPDAAGIKAWLAGQPSAVVEAWHKLTNHAQIAKQLNQTNGKLIQTHLQFNQQALATLMSAAKVADVYGADGQPRTGASSTQRSIGKG
jgi:flagellar biosynthesis protein FlgN